MKRFIDIFLISGFLGINTIIIIESVIEDSKIISMKIFYFLELKNKWEFLCQWISLRFMDTVKPLMISLSSWDSYGVNIMTTIRFLVIICIYLSKKAFILFFFENFKLNHFIGLVKQIKFLLNNIIMTFEYFLDYLITHSHIKIFTESIL